MATIRTLLIANRGEIAIRIARAARELGIRPVTVYSAEDRFGAHRFAGDASRLVGVGKSPIDAYLDVGDLLRVARDVGADAIHPGYGFLSEKPELADACLEAGVEFVGPSAAVLRALGNKVAAHRVARSANVPVLPATGPLPESADEIARLADSLGYPVLVKASWGGGGRGMRAVSSPRDLLGAVEAARREALRAFGNGEVFLEKLVTDARHVEVQILGDRHGNIVHLFERDCTVQRRNQKVVERAPSPYLSAEGRRVVCELALRVARAVNYTHAGTVEFLMDASDDAFYFIEVNPRLQVEHTVTEAITGIDIVKAQLRITEGEKIGEPRSGVPVQRLIRFTGEAVQCRVTAEDPARDFAPSRGRIDEYRPPGGFGVRVDEGDVFAGARVEAIYDPLLLKITTHGNTSAETTGKMSRALAELRLSGVRTNVGLLEKIIAHPSFAPGRYTTRFIDTTPELLRADVAPDEPGKLLPFVASVIVDGNPDVRGKSAPRSPVEPPVVPALPAFEPPAGSRDRLRALGPEAIARWMRECREVLVTDTTMRDAHQSLLATRMRTLDLVAIAPHYARLLPRLFSIECFGGATFDTALRFLKEDPWERLRKLRRLVPNILFQMLLRGSNAVGYANYPENVVRHFVQQAAKEGVDLFRVFDSFNQVSAMRAAMDAVRENGALCEGTVCYTSDIFDAKRPKYGIGYYVRIARDLERAGAHILGVKDMAGVCRPPAARALVKALREETGLPIHFHTHDTSGVSAASVLAAAEAGCDAVDCAIDSMSGLTSQPSMGGVVAALAGTDREPSLSLESIQSISRYWEGVRKLYAPFEGDLRAGTSDVYRHEMPGGQYTNLREQARALGLGQRFAEVAEAYARVNTLFGDVVKVTPTSKVVGDLALFIVANDLTDQDVLSTDRDITFPQSVVSLFRGDLGAPEDGFPEALRRKVLGAEPARHAAPAAVDLARTRLEAERATGGAVDDAVLASYSMYPDLTVAFVDHQIRYGDVSVLPTSVFFYGMAEHEETSFELGGSTHVLKYVGKSPPGPDRQVQVFFELDGAARSVSVLAVANDPRAPAPARLRAVQGDRRHVAARVDGRIAALAVDVGDPVAEGDPLLCVESMKTEFSITAPRDGRVSRVHVAVGARVENGDLLMELE
ncbi:MAG TPA: pyruvate carboxylase [Polyangiaceae bacterium]|nr:pyruvate carboxylase [Polyangiaceae bacterium]